MTETGKVEIFYGLNHTRRHLVHSYKYKQRRRKLTHDSNHRCLY